MGLVHMPFKSKLDLRAIPLKNEGETPLSIRPPEFFFTDPPPPDSQNRSEPPTP